MVFFTKYWDRVLLRSLHVYRLKQLFFSNSMNSGGTLTSPAPFIIVIQQSPKKGAERLSCSYKQRVIINIRIFIISSLKYFTSTSYPNQRRSRCYRGSGNCDCRGPRRRRSLLRAWRFVSELCKLVEKHLPGTLDFHVFWSCFLFPGSCWVSRTNKLIWTFVTPVLVVCLVRFLHNSFRPLFVCFAFVCVLVCYICFFVSPLLQK